jgi:hypothetical protein
MYAGKFGALTRMPGERRMFRPGACYLPGPL